MLAISQLPGQVASVLLYGRSGLRYVVQASSNLTNWTSISTNLLQGNSVYIYEPISGAAGSRFYRAFTP